MVSLRMVTKSVFPKIRGTFLGGPHNKDKSILGCIYWGLPIYGNFQKNGWIVDVYAAFSYSSWCRNSEALNPTIKQSPGSSAAV